MSGPVPPLTIYVYEDLVLLIVDIENVKDEEVASLRERWSEVDGSWFGLAGIFGPVSSFPFCFLNWKKKINDYFTFIWLHLSSLVVVVAGLRFFWPIPSYVTNLCMFMYV